MKTKIGRHHFTILLLSFFLIALPCRAQTQFPDTPAGKQTKAWLDAFNAGDLDKYKEFLSKNSPSRLQRAEGEMRFRQATGGFDVRKVEESTPTKIVALVQERLGDQFARLSVEVDASEQHQITKLMVQAIDRPAEFA